MKHAFWIWNELGAQTNQTELSCAKKSNVGMNFHVVGAQKQDVTQKVSTLLLYKTSEETQTQTQTLFLFLVISVLIFRQHTSGWLSNSTGDNGFRC